MDCKRVYVAEQGGGCGSLHDLKEPCTKRQKFEEMETITVEPEDFECAICYDIILEPVVGKCGHDYCKHCIDEWRKKQGSCLSCPICRETLLTSSRDTLGVCRRLREMVERLFPEKLALRRVRVAAILAAKAAKAAAAQAEAEAAAVPAPESRQERGRAQSHSHDRSRGRSRGSSSSSSRSRSRSRGRSGHNRGRSHRSRERRNEHREQQRNTSHSRHQSDRRQTRPMSHRYSNQYHFSAYGNYGVHYQQAIPPARPMYPTPPPFRHAL